MYTAYINGDQYAFAFLTEHGARYFLCTSPRIMNAHRTWNWCRLIRTGLFCTAILGVLGNQQTHSQTLPFKNVARQTMGAMAVADSEFFGQPEAHLYAAKDSIDGSFSSGGWAGVGSPPHSLTINFKTNYWVHSIAVYEWPQAYMTSGRIEFWNGASWSLLATISKNASGWKFSLPQFVLAKSVRLTVTAATVPGGWFNRTAVIEEFEVYGSEDPPTTLLQERFEGSSWDERISVLRTGSYEMAPDVRDLESFGIRRGFGFGYSTCSSSCFDNNATILRVTFPQPTWVSGIAFKELELGSNWGSKGHILANGVEVPDSTFGRSPSNDLKADTQLRSHTNAINLVVTNLDLRVWDITRSSEIVIGDLEVYGIAVGIPVLVSQPQSLERRSGEPFELSVNATGSRPMAFEWYKDSRIIVGATNSLLSVERGIPQDSGAYFVIARNDLGATTSLVARVSIALPRSANEWLQLGFQTNGVYSIDPDGRDGMAPIAVDCLMSLSGGGWTRLTASIGDSLLNTDSSVEREYLYVRNGTAQWFRTPMSQLSWSWTSGKDLYGEYFYSNGTKEGSFLVKPSGEKQLYGVGASSGPGCVAKCLIYYNDYKNSATAQVELCQVVSDVLGCGCFGPYTVYIRERSVQGQKYRLDIEADPVAGGAACCAGDFARDQLVSVVATNVPGYRFDRWEGDAVNDPRSAETTIRMDGAKAVVARFRKIWSLALPVSPEGSGEVSGAGIYDDGVIANIVARPSEGASFLGWVGEGVLNPSSDATSVLMDHDRTIEARFSAPDLLPFDVRASSTAVAGALSRLSWSITNAGSAPAMGRWVDQVRLRRVDQPGDDIPASSFEISFRIPSNEAIQRVHNVQIPPGLQGEYWVVVEANVDGGIGELSNSNNVSISSRPILISPAPFPNLSIASVAAPQVAFAGQETEVRWAVTNAGPRSTGSAQWEDAVYWSTDAQWDSGDPLLGSAPNPSALASGQSYLSSMAVRIPTRVQGPFYLIVRTDFRNRVPEGGLDGDNSKTSDPIQVSLPGWPDLRVTALVSPFEAFSGQPATITWAVTNAGSLRTDETTWVDRIYLSTNQTFGGGAIPLGSSVHDGVLQSGDSYRQSHEVVLPVGISGTNFFFFVETDSQHSAWEYVFESNNMAVSSHPTEIHLTPPPDLEVVSVSVGSSVCAGTDLTVAYRVANNGANDTPNFSWQDGFYLSQDTSLDPRAAIYLGAVPHRGQLLRGQSYDATANLRVPEDARGNQYLIVVVDSQSSVFELDKSNNSRSSTDPVVIPSLADLQITGVKVPANGIAGFDVSVTYQVTNAGVCTTLGDSWTDSFYLSTNQNLQVSADTLIGTVPHSGQLVPGSAYTNTVSLRLPIGQSGNFHLFVRADSQSRIPEQNEGNNSGISAAAMNLQLPSNDLAVLGIGAPTNALSGFNLTLTCVVTNLGTNGIPNASWRDGFYLSTDPSFSTNDLYLGEVEHPGTLAAGGSYTNSLTVRLPDGLAGQFHVFVAADSAAQVFESDEVDNIAMGALPITIVSIPPDLVVESCRAPAGTYIAGGALAVDWSIRNTGPGQTSVDAWSDVVVLSRDATLGNDDDVALAAVAHSGALNPSATYSVAGRSVTIQAGIAAGTYRLFIQSDSAREVFEGSADANNACPAGTIDVIRPDVDFVVTSVSVTNEAHSGQNLTVVWKVQNQGNSSANPTAWSDAIYLSRDVLLGTNAVLLGTAARSGGLGPQAAYTVTNEFALPWDAQGDYYVIVRADAGSQVPESLEDNNDAGSTSPCYVHLSPTPDLLVSAIQVPVQVTSGQPVALSWTVLNNGAATEQKWYDAVYLSFDQILDRKADIYLGYVEHADGLDEGSSYTVNHTFDIPPSLYGTAYVIVVADSTDRVFERQAEANNIGRSGLVNLDLPPLSDLVVTAVNPPADLAMVGSNNTITYQVLNQSANAASGRWEDTLFLSTDQVWDIDDTPLGKVTVEQSLGPWESYDGTLTAQIPGVLPGNYFIILRSDIRNSIPESDEGNNFGVALHTVQIDMVELTVNAAYTNSFYTGKDDFYKVLMPSNTTLFLTLSSAITNASTEMFTRFGAVPDRTRYDFGDSSSFPRKLFNVVPRTEEGYYYTLARGANIPDPTTTYSISAAILGFGIYEVAPRKIGNAGRSTLSVMGAMFTSNTVILLKNNAMEIYPFEQFVYGPAYLQGRFDLRGVSAGTYDMTIRDSFGRSESLTNAIEIIDGGQAKLSLEFFGPDRIRPGIRTTYKAYLLNSGFVDAENVVIRFRGSVGGASPQPISGIGWGYEGADIQLLPIVPPINITRPDVLRQVSGENPRFPISPTPIEVPIAVTVPAPLCLSLNGIATTIDDPDHPLTCEDIDNMIRDAVRALSSLQRQLSEAQAELDDCIKRSMGCQDLVEKIDNLRARISQIFSILEFLRARARAMGCGIFTPSHYAEGGAKSMNLGHSLLSVQDEPASGGSDTASLDVCVVRPVDPNEKIGVVGYGPNRFVDAQIPLSYTVYFENVPEAVAFAREITVVDQLAPSLDARTVRLTEFGFGKQRVIIPGDQSFWQQKITLSSNLLADIIGFVDVQSQTIYWKLRAIDAATGEPPDGAEVGLLPPNDATHRGEGYVTYTVQAAQGGRTGTVITNAATIVFDNSEPIEAAPTWNTIDARSPNSSITALSTYSLNSFEVCWSGVDDLNGSGVKDYAIYVSDNGDPYRPWLANTTNNCSVYHGEAGHTYRFYSLARDNVGNLEPAPPIPDFTTTVSGNTAPRFDGVADESTVVNDTLQVTNTVWDAEIHGQKLQFTMLQGPATASLRQVSPTNVVFRWTPACADGSTTNLVRIKVQDNGSPSLAATNNFWVAVHECVEVSLGRTSLLSGEPSCVPLDLLSTVELTNLTFSVMYPTDRFTKLSLRVTSQHLTRVVSNVVAADETRFSIDLPADRVLRGPTNVATLCFESVGGQPSAFVPLVVTGVDGRRPNGDKVGNAYGVSGRVAVIGDRPLLDAWRDEDGLPVLGVYGAPGTTLTLESATVLGEASVWQLYRVIQMTEHLHVIKPVCTNDCSIFIRARSP